MNECSLPDVQETKPKFEIPIRQVGVQNVEVPFRLEAKHGGFHQLIANVSMRTDLDSCTKGISMSRLIRTLKEYLELPLKQKLIKEILMQLQENVGSKNSFMKFEFRLPVNRESIVSREMFPIYYRSRFEGQLRQYTDDEKYGMDLMRFDDAIAPDYKFRFFQGVIVQYASYCPCSAELCKALGDSNIPGFPHNQRSFANVLIETEPDAYIWLEDIIEAIEERIPTLPYPIIKREDEQEIARVAARNPMFVEDAIRAISQSLHERKGIKDWIVKCTHEESIHTSEAIAINWKGVPNGFDGRRFI